MFGIRKIIIACALSWCMLQPVFAHDNMHEVNWTTRYTDKKGGNCCGKHDCVQVKARMVHMQGDTATFEIMHNGQTFTIENFPLKGYHSSEDEFDYFCFFIGHLDEYVPYIKVQHPCFYIQPNNV